MTPCFPPPFLLASCFETLHQSRIPSAMQKQLKQAANLAPKLDPGGTPPASWSTNSPAALHLTITSSSVAVRTAVAYRASLPALADSRLLIA